MTRTRPINLDFGTDRNIQRLQKGLPDAFFSTFHKGVLNYLEGRWPAAQGYLRRVLKRYMPHDGPSKVLLRYMRNHGKAKWNDKADASTPRDRDGDSGASQPATLGRGTFGLHGATGVGDQGSDDGGVSPELRRHREPSDPAAASGGAGSGLQGSLPGQVQGGGLATVVEADGEGDADATGVAGRSGATTEDGGSGNDAKVRKSISEAAAALEADGPSHAGSLASNEPSPVGSTARSGAFSPAARAAGSAGDGAASGGGGPVVLHGAARDGAPPPMAERRRAGESEEAFFEREVRDDSIVWDSPSDWKGYRQLTEK